MAELTDAAVLIPVSGRSVVFTVRAKGLPSHAGHVSFPGGKREPRDDSLEDTALREAEEEINLTRDVVAITASLPPHETLTSGFRIKPFVGRIPTEYSFSPNDEVDDVFTVPISELLENERWDGGETRYPCRSYTIWGATARILSTFLDTMPAYKA